MLKSAADALKTAKATGNLIANKIIDKSKKVSRTSPQNSSETITNKPENIRLHREIPKERYVSPEKKTTNYWWFNMNIIIQ